MKKLTLITALLLLSFAGQAQTKVKKDAQGNYITVNKPKADSARFTGHTFIDSKLKEWPVYISANDKLYYLRTSKSGNQYKVYIKED
jgi:hypothetical protein